MDDVEDDKPKKHNFSLDTLHENLSRTLVVKTDVIKLSNTFRALDSNSERVYLTLDVLKDYYFLPEIVKGEKSDENSEERRKYGNHLFVALKKDHEAMKHYNKSIAYAKTKEALALAYGNRSAVLFQNKFYKECIIDIEYALNNGYPEHLIQKIKDRKQKAETKLNESIHEEYFHEIPSVSGSNNAKIECASDNIIIQENDTMGRHIIAVKNILPGDIIAVEKPYATVLLYKNYRTHCHNCLKISYNLIPCLKCPLVLFCSEMCRDLAWERYHKYECTILDTLHSIEATKLHLMALRIVICARNEFQNVLNENFEQTALYKSESFQEIYNLVTNQEKRVCADLFSRSEVASVLFHLLSTTDFFDFDNDVEKMKDCTAELLLRFLQIVPSNMHTISEIRGNIKNGYLDAQVGSGAYGFLSLVNHSCIPNVTRFSCGTTKVLFALRPIKIGEQLFDNYGYHHALNKLDERKTHLKDQYCFVCECEACVHDYPLYYDMPAGINEPLTPEQVHLELTAANRAVAQQVMPEFIRNAINFEKSPLRKTVTFLNNQEFLKQCYFCLGSKHTIF